MLRGFVYVEETEKHCICIKSAQWQKRFLVLRDGTLFVFENAQVSDSPCPAAGRRPCPSCAKPAPTFRARSRSDSFPHYRAILNADPSAASSLPLRFPIPPPPRPFPTRQASTTTALVTVSLYGATVQPELDVGDDDEQRQNRFTVRGKDGSVNLSVSSVDEVKVRRAPPLAPSPASLLCSGRGDCSSPLPDLPILLSAPLSPLTLVPLAVVSDDSAGSHCRERRHAGVGDDVAAVERRRGGLWASAK